MNDHSKGTVNENVGKAKTAAGNAVGDKRLASEGRSQQSEGFFQKIIGDAKSEADQEIDAAKQKVDSFNP